MKAVAFLKERPLHLFFFSLLFVLNHFFEIALPTNSDDSFWIVVRNFIGAVVIIYVPVFALFKLASLKFEKTKAEVASILLFVPFFSFQDLFDIALRLTNGSIRIILFLPILFIIVITLCYLVIISKRSFRIIKEYLNLVSFALVCYVGSIVIISFEGFNPTRLSHLQSQVAPRSLNCTSCPDIYFFILDAYTSNKSLRDFYDFDNSEFTGHLDSLGFQVQDQAESSYSFTQYSLAATFNFSDIGKLGHYYSKDVVHLIKNGAVIRSLQNKGYEIHTYSLFEVADNPSFYSLGYKFDAPMIDGIFRSTILSWVVENLMVFSNQYEVNREILNKTTEQAKERSTHPRFFYAHIMAPHTPLVMDERGNKLDLLSLTTKLNKKTAYLNQLKGVNVWMSKTVDDILKSSPGSIILIQGDHGSRFIQGVDKKKEAFSVFLAYRGPGKDSLGSLNRSNEIFNFLFKNLDGSK